jgi:hypothetical protein
LKEGRRKGGLRGQKRKGEKWLRVQKREREKEAKG